MNINPAAQSGLNGIQTGSTNLRQTAQEIAQAGTTNTTANIAEPMVDLKVSELQIQASTKVIKSADEVLGSLIDTLA